MPTQLKDAEDSHKPDYTKNGQRHGLIGAFILRTDGCSWQVQGVLLFGDYRCQRDEVWNDGDYIDNVHDVPEEIELVGTRQEAHGQLEREPNNTDGFDEEKRICDIRHLVLFYLGTVGGCIEHFVVFEFGQRFQAEDNDGQQDDEYGNDSDDSSCLRRFWILEEQPDVSLELVRWQRLLLFLDKPFVFPKLVDRQLPQLIKFNLFGEDIERYVDRPP